MRWLLIDGGWLAHRVRHSFGSDWKVSEDPTGFLFGLLDQLRVLCHDPRFQSNRLAIFLDSRSSRRRRLLPGYKKNRISITSEERIELDAMRGQMKIAVKEIFPRIGISTYEQDGYEADDLIASAADVLSGTDQFGVIITGDGDLYQCITSHVTWYNPTRRLYYTERSFFSEKGIEADRWGGVKALAGCVSDCVVGVKGVGEKIAIRYLQGVLPGHLKVWRTITCEGGIRLIRANRRLVVLPFEGTKPVLVHEPAYSLDGFTQVCNAYRLGPLLYGKRWQEWKRILTNKMSVEDRQTPRKRRSR